MTSTGQMPDGGQPIAHGSGPRLVAREQAQPFQLVGALHATQHGPDRSIVFGGVMEVGQCVVACRGLPVLLRAFGAAAQRPQVAPARLNGPLSLSSASRSVSASRIVSLPSATPPSLCQPGRRRRRIGYCAAERLVGGAPVHDAPRGRVATPPPGRASGPSTFVLRRSGLAAASAARRTEMSPARCSSLTAGSTSEHMVMPVTRLIPARAAVCGDRGRSDGIVLARRAGLAEGAHGWPGFRSRPRASFATRARSPTRPDGSTFGCSGRRSSVALTRQGCRRRSSAAVRRPRGEVW